MLDCGLMMHRGKGQKYLFLVIAITGEQWQVPANGDGIVC